MVGKQIINNIQEYLYPLVNLNKKNYFTNWNIIFFLFELKIYFETNQSTNMLKKFKRKKRPNAMAKRLSTYAMEQNDIIWRISRNG